MRMLILGGGVAGLVASDMVRRNSPDSRISIFTAEEFPPYYRPRLMDMLAGKVEMDEIYIKKKEWFVNNGIEVNTKKTVSAINIKQKKVSFADGTEEEYSRLLLAMGSFPFKPPIQGIDNKSVFVLRTAQDVIDIRSFAATRKKAAVIGGGLLGLESANSLRTLGIEVTVIEGSPYVLPRQVDEEGSIFIRKKIEETGMLFRLGVSTVSINPAGGGLVINFNDGSSLETDFAVVSAGVRSNMDIAKSAGIAVSRGVLVDDNLKTNIDGIYAAGDICEHRGVLYGIWPAAMEQARVAGENIAGRNTVYSGTVVSTKLKVIGIDCVSLGNIGDKEAKQFKVVDAGKGIYRKVFVKNGMITGAIFLGDSANSPVIQKMIKDKTNVSGREQEILT